MKGKSLIVEKSFQSAIKVVKPYKYLCDDKKEFVLSKQLLRSGTSIGANVREAHNAESKADFIHKMGIAQKEADETNYWLELLFETKYLTEIEFRSIHNESVELLKIIKSIILTSKQNSKSHIS